MTWAPGQSGNSSGRPIISLPVNEILRVVGEEKVALSKKPTAKSITRIEKVCRKIYEVAAMGDVGAMRYLMDRVGGKMTEYVAVQTEIFQKAIAWGDLSEIQRTDFMKKMAKSKGKKKQ